MMIRKVSKQQKEKNKEKAERTRELHLWFLSLWDKQQKNGFVKCFECGKWIGPNGRETSTTFSHILGKADFPEYEMEEWNVKLVHSGCHFQYNEQYPKQYALYKELLEKHVNGELQNGEEYSSHNNNR